MPSNLTDPHNEQEERTQRALEALRGNLFQIVVLASDRWSVKNGEKMPYTVTRDRDVWTCNCPDFQQRGPLIRCKHVEAVRLTQESQSGETHQTLTNEELFMKDTDINTSEHIRQELSHPLDMSRVKRRQAPGQGSVPYLEGFDVIQRANEIFSFGWSFDLLNEPEIMRWQKTQTYYSQQHRRKLPVLDDQSKPVTEEVGIVWITGKVTVELGDKAYTHADVGRCVFSGDTPEALDMAVAGAATDCLKRCFRQLGEQFGLSLYDKEIAQTAGLEGGNGNGHHPAPPERAGSSTTPTRQSTPPPIATSAGLSVSEAGKVVFSLKPKTRPELTGKTLSELQSIAPDILTWLANEYRPTAETQALKDAARILLTPKARESKILSELGFAS